MNSISLVKVQCLVHPSIPPDHIRTLSLCNYLTSSFADAVVLHGRTVSLFVFPPHYSGCEWTFVSGGYTVFTRTISVVESSSNDNG